MKKVLGLAHFLKTINFHPAAMGSSPKHTIYAFSIYIVHFMYLSFEREKNENEQKRGRHWSIF